MKSKMMRRIAVVVLAIALITTTALCATMAKYEETWTATQDSLTYAKWDISFFKDGTEMFTDTYADSNTFTLDLQESVTPTGNVAENVIAPGQGGTIADLKFTNDGEVDALLDLTITVTGDIPAGLNFALATGETAIALQKAENANTWTVTDAALEMGATLTADLTWTWTYENGTDSNDMTFGHVATPGSFTVDVSATATQEQPANAQG